MCIILSWRRSLLQFSLFTDIWATVSSAKSWYQSRLDFVCKIILCLECMLRQNQNAECRMILLERGAVLTEGASYRYPVTFLMCLEFCLSVSSCSLSAVLFTRVSPLLFSPNNHFCKLNFSTNLCSKGELIILSLMVCIV